jgi:hypothetical protein
MSYPTLNIADAVRYLNQKRSGGEPEPLTVGEVQHGEALDWDEIALELKTELSKLQKEIGPIEGKGGGKGAQFEAKASEIVHRILPRQHPALFDPGFFLWLTVVHFYDLVQWRFGETGKLMNFGVANRVEGLMYRLWIRGEVGFDPKNKDPYILARRGDVDFWRSHIIRQSYANARCFAKALLAYQFSGEKGKMSIEQIRALAKRLRRAKTNMVVDLLEAAEATQFIEQQGNIVLDTGG